MRYRSVILVGLLWLFLDLMTKDWMKEIGHKNTGIAFSVPVPLGLQIAISIGLIVFLLYLFIRQKKEFTCHPPLLNSFVFGIILGGACGNLVSRMMNGYVIDFIKLGPIPLFNIADLGITVGITLLILVNFLILTFRLHFSFATVWN